MQCGAGRIGTSEETCNLRESDVGQDGHEVIEENGER